MEPKIVFGVMSAVAPPAVVAQLADILHPHIVAIHHDYSQQPTFNVIRPNVRFMPNPLRTGWGTWGHLKGIFALLQWALEQEDFDYFQLLSPSCLPIRPLDEFVDYVRRGEHEANSVSMPLPEGSPQFMHYAYRAFAQEGTLRFRAMRRLRRLYFDREPQLQGSANLQIRIDYDGIARGRPSAQARLAKAATHWLGAWPDAHRPFTNSTPARIGDVWFGARPAAARYMLERFHEPSMQQWFSRVELPDELVMGTILGNAPFAVGPANHVISTFEEAHPRWMGINDVPELLRCGRYFARKFPNDDAAPVRKFLLEALQSHQKPAAAKLQAAAEDARAFAPTTTTQPGEILLNRSGPDRSGANTIKLS
jgi:Core-2/I-Branching enzyme